MRPGRRCTRAPVPKEQEIDTAATIVSPRAAAAPERQDRRFEAGRQREPPGGGRHPRGTARRRGRSPVAADRSRTTSGAMHRCRSTTTLPPKPKRIASPPMIFCSTRQAPRSAASEPPSLESLRRARPSRMTARARDDEVMARDGVVGGRSGGSAAADSRGFDRPCCRSAGNLLAIVRGARTSSSVLAGCVLLLVAGIALGLVGGYALCGRRGTPIRPAVPRQRRRSGSTSANAPATGREFSEQAVTPPAPKATGPPGSGSWRRQIRGAADGRPGTPGRYPTGSEPAGSRGIDRNTGREIDANRGRRDVERTLAWPHSVDPGRSAVPPLRRACGAAGIRDWNAGGRPLGGCPGAIDRPGAEAVRGIGIGASPGPGGRPARTPPRPAPAPEEPQSSTVYTGSIYVDSRPRGARVSIDGKAVGVTPLRVQRRAHRHSRRPSRASRSPVVVQHHHGHLGSRNSA